MILEDVLFFGLSVGYTMGWTALSSELGTLKALHGSNVLLFLNIAYFAPSLPVLVTQLLWDPGWNRKLGAARATLYRQCVALPIVFLCTILLPYLPWTSLPTLIIISAVIGTAASLAFGSSSQLVARFPPSCGQALTLGIVSSGPIVLILQFCLAIGPHPSYTQQVLFFHMAALFPLLALYCVIRLLRRYWTPLQAGNVLLPFTGAVQVTDNSAANAASAAPAPLTSIAANAIPSLSGQLSGSTATNSLASSNLGSLANVTASASLSRRAQGTDTASSLSSSSLQQQPQQPAQPPQPPSTLNNVFRASDTGPSAPLLPPAHALLSAPATPTIDSQADTEDVESLIVGELSLPDLDPQFQDTLGLGHQNQDTSAFSLHSHHVPDQPAVTSSILPDALNTPLLASYVVSGAISDSVHASLLPEAIPYLHITIPEAEESDASQHPLLAPVPLAVDVPWSPTGNRPGGVPVQGGSFLENLATTAGADQGDVEPGRQVVVNSQYVSDVVEASSFWLAHVGTPREGAIFVSTAPQESAITTALLPPADSAHSDSLPARTERLQPSLSLTPSLVAAAADTASVLPQAVAPVPVPPTALAPQRTSILGGSALKSVTWNLAPLALCLFSSVTVCVMLFPVFTVVRSSGTLGCMLPQALFAARMMSDIIGRILASVRQPPLSIVGTVAILKAIMLPIALLYLWQPAEFLSDVAALLFVVLHWVLSGLVGAWSFMLLPRFFSGPESAAYAGAVLSAAYQFGTIAGLILASLLEYMLVPPSTTLAPVVC